MRKEQKCWDIGEGLLRRRGRQAISFAWRSDVFWMRASHDPGKHVLLPQYKGQAGCPCFHCVQFAPVLLLLFSARVFQT